MVSTFTYKPSLVRIDARNFKLSWNIDHKHTPPARHRQDREQYTAPLSLARSVITENYRYRKLTENSVLIMVWPIKVRLRVFIWFRARGLEFRVRVGDRVSINFRYISVVFGNYHSPCRREDVWAVPKLGPAASATSGSAELARTTNDWKIFCIRIPTVEICQTRGTRKDTLKHVTASQSRRNDLVSTPLVLAGSRQFWARVRRFIHGESPTVYEVTKLILFWTQYFENQTCHRKVDSDI